MREVVEQLEIGGHELIGQADHIGTAFDMLREMADGSLNPDVLIIDGTLDDANGPTSFTYCHVDQFVSHAVKQGLFLKRPKAIETPKITTVELDMTRNTQRHSRAILQIVDRLDIDVRTVGFSLSAMIDDVRPDRDNRKFPRFLNADIKRVLAEPKLRDREAGKQ